MAKRNRISLDFKGLEQYSEKIDKLGGNLKEVVEEALVKSNEKVATNLLSITHKNKYPAKGKYSVGDTRDSIITSKHVDWLGDFAEIAVGFDFSVSGLKSIFLMYGTPRMKKVQAIYNAIYGKKTKKEIAEMQEEIFSRAIQEIMGG